MSMTLKRRVNGQVVPIKLSLLDAFKGVPPPRKRRAAPKMRSSATQTSPEPVHVPTVKDQETAQTLVTDVASDTKPTGGSSDNTSVTKHGEAHILTAADDAKLIELKAAGKTWKEIVAEMRKSHSAVKQRFKEIGPKADCGNKDEGRVDEAEDEKAKEESAAKAAEKKGESDEKDIEKEESGAKAAEKEMPGDQTQQAAKADKNKQDAIKPKGATAKSNPIGAETNEAIANRLNLAEIAARYEQDKWRSAASKYFDLTGNRISSKTAQEWAEAAN